MCKFTTKNRHTWRMAIKNLLENNPQCRLALICPFSFVSALSSIPFTAPLMFFLFPVLLFPVHPFSFRPFPVRLFPVRLFSFRPFPFRPFSVRLFSVSCASGATPKTIPPVPSAREGLHDGGEVVRACINRWLPKGLSFSTPGFAHITSGRKG